MIVALPDAFAALFVVGAAFSLALPFDLVARAANGTFEPAVCLPLPFGETGAGFLGVRAVDDFELDAEARALDAEVALDMGRV